MFIINNIIYNEQIWNYKREEQGRWGRICEIVRVYIEQIMTKSDAVIRSLEFQRKHIEKYIDKYWWN